MDDPPYGLFSELTEFQLESASSAEGTQSRVDGILLPALRRIRFSFPDFEVQDIVEYLRLRHENGAMVNEVLLEGCEDLPTEDVDRIRGLVGNVIWETEDLEWQGEVAYDDYGTEDSGEE